MTKEQIESFPFNKQQHFVQQREKEQRELVNLVNLHDLEVNACSAL